MRVVKNAQVFADTICEKLRLLLHLTLTVQVSGCGSTTPSEGMHGYKADSIVDISVGFWGGTAEYQWKILSIDDQAMKVLHVSMDYKYEN